jgi:predicted NAD/FAD-dependent oxidoreductase
MTAGSLSRSRRRRVGIIGAGMAGLAAARTLGELGHDAIVFDKGRGPGGRSTSRRAAPFAFDHGAQYFTACNPLFRCSLTTWLKEGVVVPWQGHLVTLCAGEIGPLRGATERFVGTPGMNAIAKHLARGVEVHCSSPVATIERKSGGWELTREDGADLGRFDQLVITAPPPQAAALIGDGSPLGRCAAEIVMRPCWAVLLGLAEPYSVPFDGAFCEGSALSWIARDSSKPGRPAAEAWVLHASAEWSEGHLGEDPELVAEFCAAELERLTGVPLPYRVHREAHRWGHARPQAKLEEGVLVDPEQGLILAGDAYRGGRIEGAYMSGVTAADRIEAEMA